MMWLGLIFIVLLTFFSIYGAFLGAEKARQFFNSMPLSLYWTAFGLLIAASIAVFPRLIKSPGLLAMHAGCVLIIAGSMWGSFAGHRMQRKYFDSKRVRSARISIVEGYSDEKMYLDEDLSSEQTHNSIETTDFTIKYNYDSQTIDFISDDKIFRKEPVVLQQQITLGVNASYITPLKFFHNLGFKTVDGKEVAFDDPGGGSSPALEVKYVDSDGKESTRLLSDISFYGLPFFIRLNDFRIEYYKEPKLIVVDEKGLIWSGPAEIGKTIDLGPEYGKITPNKVFSNLVYDNGQFKDVPGTSGKPAVEILVDFPGQPQQKRYTHEKDSESGPEPCLVEQKYAIRMSRTISDYISELEILDKDGKLLAAKDIEVNKPLHYGGYHFYQTSYKQFSDGTYATVLSVTSDSGLYCVFAGFAAMCGGILYHQWIRPILKKKKQKPKEAAAQG